MRGGYLRHVFLFAIVVRSVLCFCNVRICLLWLCWSFCSVFGLFAMVVGCCVYVLCHVCVAVLLVMYLRLWSLSVMSFAILSALSVLVVLLILFVLCAMCTGMCG